MGLNMAAATAMVLMFVAWQAYINRNNRGGRR